MLLHSPLSTITSMVEADVLAVLARADAEFTVQTLDGMIEHRSPEGIRRALDRLTEQGVVLRRNLGRARGYTLNRKHLAAPAIIELATLTQELHRRIRDRIAEWREQPTYAAIFGSGAREEMRSDSDIDLALVFEQTPSETGLDAVLALTGDIHDWTGNVTNPLVLNSTEINGHAHDNPVLTDIAREGLTMYGDVTAYRRLVGAR